VETTKSAASGEDLLGSVHVLSYTMGEIVEEDLLRRVAGKMPMTLTQLRLLKLVSHPGTHTITEVSAFMGISKAAASKAADRLVRAGCMRREEGTKDRRAIFLSLTAAGTRILKGFESARIQLLADAAGGFSTEEIGRAAALIDSLSAVLIRKGSEKGDVCVRCRIHFLDKCLVRQHLDRECEYEILRRHFSQAAGRS